ncbi:MAG: class I poly(R)-hydroxyalkanoic acid synthase, partial [Alphaproteobacteria bacterium]|nr:class I poly(R)-hydroxyalkanoic acid synthase [Alphaproteobacteria bacterium]
MPDQPANKADSKPNNEMSETFASIAERSQRLVSNFVAQQGAPGAQFGTADPTSIGNTFLEL